MGTGFNVVAFERVDVFGRAASFMPDRCRRDLRGNSAGRVFRPSCLLPRLPHEKTLRSASADMTRSDLEDGSQ